MSAAAEQFSAGPPQGSQSAAEPKLAPSGGSAVHAVTSVGATYPLAGVTVVDLGQIYNGPYCTFLMAMAGARIIKIEAKGGENLRRRGVALCHVELQQEFRHAQSQDRARL